MQFNIDQTLLTQARSTLSKYKKLYWLLGGSGSGKTTISQALSTKFSIPIYDMDAHIYGTYHERFTEEKHPANKAWANAENGMAWLLKMSWGEFYNFNQAALPEYLDLLAEDMRSVNPNATLLIDGGIWHPALLAQVMPLQQMICITTAQSSIEIWEGNPERYTLREMFNNFPEPDTSWQKFLEFDEKITETSVKESRESNISVCSRGRTESVDEFAKKVAQILALGDEH